MTLRLTLLLTLAVLAAGCGADSSPETPEGGLTVRDLPSGGDLSTRQDLSTVRSLTLGDQWCEVGYETASGETRTADGYRSLCQETDRIGQEVLLGFTTFGIAGESCEDGDLDCADVETIEVVNVFLDPEALADTTATPDV